MVNELEKAELEIIDQETIKDMIYEIKGQKVMLDFDLARIYGYETKNFNKQVKRNIEKFPDRYRFQLTKEELENLMRFQNATSLMWVNGYHSGGRTSLPYAFTESGIYMLMTVLKGELATKQSINIIDTFKLMRDVIINSNYLLTNTNQYIESRFNEYDERFDKVENQLSIVMNNFIDTSKYKEFLILDGQRIEADIAYQSIYKLAKQSIIIIDDYIDIRSLRQLKVCDKNIEITICSNNNAKNKITNGDINDFIIDTGIDIKLLPTNNIVHDRYIVIDYQSDNEKIYLSGNSSKNAGDKVSTIIEISDVNQYHDLIDELLIR